MAKAIAEKGRAILRAKEIFPEFNLMDYDISLARNLSFYNTEIEDSKRKKEWTISYWKESGKDVSKVSKVHDGYFNTAGAVAHMIKHRNLPLAVRDIVYLDRKYLDFVEMSVKEPEAEISIEEKLQEKELKFDAALNLHITEFELGIDMFFHNKEFNAKSYLLRNNVKSTLTRAIAEHFKPMVKEIKLAMLKKDEQLEESYAFLGPRQLSKFAKYIQMIIDSCEVATATAKAARKPRETKVKPVSELIKDIKFLIKDDISGLTSMHPSKLIGASEVWVYNAKNRRLFRYLPLNGTKLTVKGSTIVNVDIDKSGGKIIRKPETQLVGLVDRTSKFLNKLFDDIHCTESRGVGRLDENSIIVNVF